MLPPRDQVLGGGCTCGDRGLGAYRRSGTSGVTETCPRCTRLLADCVSRAVPDGPGVVRVTTLPMPRLPFADFVEGSVTRTDADWEAAGGLPAGDRSTGPVEWVAVASATCRPASSGTPAPAGAGLGSPEGGVSETLAGSGFVFCPH